MPDLKPPVSAQDHSQGVTDAPLTLVEYGDYQCPFCGRAYPLVKAAQAELGENLRFIFRNFPISTIHPFAEGAAEAAEIAAISGRFWDMHDLLYENQTTLDPDHLVDNAVHLGLDRESFISDLESHKCQEKVKSDFLSGVRSGVNGTPTFFINGVRYDGSWDHGHLITALQQALNDR